MIVVLFHVLYIGNNQKEKKEGEQNFTIFELLSHRPNNLKQKSKRKFRISVLLFTRKCDRKEEREKKKWTFFCMTRKF